MAGSEGKGYRGKENLRLAECVRGRFVLPPLSRPIMSDLRFSAFQRFIFLPG